MRDTLRANKLYFADILVTCVLIYFNRATYMTFGVLENLVTYSPVFLKYVFFDPLAKFTRIPFFTNMSYALRILIFIVIVSMGFRIDMLLLLLFSILFVMIFFVATRTYRNVLNITDPQIGADMRASDIYAFYTYVMVHNFFLSLAIALIVPFSIIRIFIDDSIAMYIASIIAIFSTIGINGLSLTLGFIPGRIKSLPKFDTEAALFPAKSCLFMIYIFILILNQLTQLGIPIQMSDTVAGFIKCNEYSIVIVIAVDRVFSSMQKEKERISTLSIEKRIDEPSIQDTLHKKQSQKKKKTSTNKK